MGGGPFRTELAMPSVEGANSAFRGGWSPSFRSGFSHGSVGRGMHIFIDARIYVQRHMHLFIDAGIY